MSDSTLNVRCFGAQGDGRANDTAAIKDAVSAIKRMPNASGILKFPNGTYKIDETAFQGIHGLNGLVIEGTTISELPNEGTTIQYEQCDSEKDRAMLFFPSNSPRNLYFSIRNVKIQGSPQSGHLFHTERNVALSWLELDRVILTHRNPTSSLVLMEDTYAAHMSFRDIRAKSLPMPEKPEVVRDAALFEIKGRRWFQLEFDNVMINMPNATKPAMSLENTDRVGETAGASLRRITFQGTRSGAVRIRGVQYISFDHVVTGDYEGDATAPAFDIGATEFPDTSVPNTARKITFINCVSNSGTEENPDIRVCKRHRNEAPILINCRIGYLDAQREDTRPIIIGASSIALDEIPNFVGETTTPLELLPSGRIAGIASISATREPGGYALRGTIKFSDNARKVTQRFASSEPDNSYHVLLTPTRESGSPAVGSNRVKKVDKEKKEFTVHIEAAPGKNAEVSFDWLIIR